jgi:hypothetical protein
MARDRSAPASRAGDRFEILARDSILLADADCLEFPRAHKTAHGAHMQAQSLRDLLQ